MNMNLFYNSECLFVEYLDIIKAPAFTLLSLLKKNEKIKNILNVGEIAHLENQALAEWYINRKHFNPLEDLILPEVEYTKEDIDQFLYDQINSSNLIYDYTSSLCFLNAIKFTSQQKLVKNIYIYLPFKNDYVEKSFKKETGLNCEFLTGDFGEAIKDIPNDSTFVLSDMEKMQIMKDKGKLHLSSVLIPFDYRYNKELDNRHKYKFNVFEQEKDCVYKYALFKAFN